VAAIIDGGTATSTYDTTIDGGTATTSSYPNDPISGGDAGPVAVPPGESAWPLLRVEIDSSPNATAWAVPTAWTTISTDNYVLAVSIRRGQQEAYGPVEPGEMVLRLHNRNGHLDPKNAASPFAALLTTGRQLRVVHVKSDNTEQTLFHGVVQRWPSVWSPVPGGAASVELLVLDVLANLGSMALPHSLVEYELHRGVRYPRPSSLFPMSESPSQDMVYASTTSDFKATPIGTGPRAASSPLLPYTDPAGIEIDSDWKVTLTLPSSAMPALPNSDPWAVGVVVAVQEDGWTFAFSDGRTWVATTLDASRVAQTRIRQSDGTSVTVNGTTRLDDGRPHLILVVKLTDGVELYVDGVREGAALTSPSDTWQQINLGRGKDAAMAMVMLWDNGATRLLDNPALLYADIFRPWQGHTATTRIGALLDIAAPGSARSLATSAFVHLPVSMKGLPALDVIRRTAESVDGRSWVDRSNAVRFDVRPVGEPPAAIRTYGVGGVPIADMAFSEAESNDRVTHCIATNESGTRAGFHDTKASERGQARLELFDRTLQNLSDLWNLAERTVHHRSAIQPYVERIDIDAAAAGYDNTLALDLYNPVAVAYRRPWAATIETEQALVVGVDHDADAESEQSWTTTLRLRPHRQRRLYMAVPATGDVGASTPDAAANNITGDIDLRARVVRANWRSSDDGAVVAKGQPFSPSAAYRLAVERGRIAFRWQNAAGTAFHLSARIPRTGNRLTWIRATLMVATGTARLFVSNDGHDWHLLKEQAFGATDIRSTTQPLNVGVAQNDDGTLTLPLDGQVMYADIRPLGQATPSQVFDPTADAAGVGATSWAASTGETWTVRTTSIIDPF
jgi:hypothetical protein